MTALAVRASARVMATCRGEAGLVLDRVACPAIGVVLGDDDVKEVFLELCAEPRVVRASPHLDIKLWGLRDDRQGVVASTVRFEFDKGWAARDYESIAEASLDARAIEDLMVAGKGSDLGKVTRAALEKLLVWSRNVQEGLGPEGLQGQQGKGAPSEAPFRRSFEGGSLVGTWQPVQRYGHPVIEYAADMWKDGLEPEPPQRERSPGTGRSARDLGAEHD